MRAQDFERLYKAEAQALFGFLAYRTGDRVLAEDLLADTFERALRARRRFDPGKASGKTWLYAIALNRLRDHVRRSQSEARAVERLGSRPEGDHDPGIGRAEDRDTVQRAMSALSVEEREVISLRYGAELTAPEMADVLGVKLTTVEGRLYRGLGKLRDKLGTDTS